MRTITRILCLLAMSGTPSAQAAQVANPNDIHQLGKVAVTVPPPAGFEQVPRSDPRVAGTGVLAVFAPPGIQVLGSAVPPRLAVADVLPDMRETDVTAADFAALKATFRMPAVIDGIAAAMQRSLFQLMPQINVGLTSMPVRSLGVIDDDQNSVSVAFAWGVQSAGVAIMSVVSDTTLFIRGRLLVARLIIVGISSEDAGKHELSDLARSWAEAIVTANAGPP
jgi:hypothetical protein